MGERVWKRPEAEETGGSAWQGRKRMEGRVTGGLSAGIWQGVEMDGSGWRRIEADVSEKGPIKNRLEVAACGNGWKRVRRG